MAQEHQLKLKAILDTSDVQNKLNQLNRQQGGSSSPASSPSQSGLGNVAQNINNVLMRLNNSITQLNQSIVRLTNSTRVPAQTTNKNSPNSPTIIPPSGGRNMDAFGAVGNITDRVIENEVRTWVKRAIKAKNERGWLGQQLETDFNNGIFAGNIGTPAQRAKFQEMFGGMRWRELNDKKYRQYVDEYLNPRKNEFKMNPLYERTMKYVLGGQVLGQFASLGQQHADLYGNTGLSRGLGALQNVIQSAAFGSMLGPNGMLIGGAIGIGQSIYEDYISGLKEKEDKVFESIQNAGIKRKYNTSRANFAQDQSIYSAIKSSDIDSLQSIRDSLVIKQQNAEAGLSVLDKQPVIDPTVASDLQATLASTLSKIRSIDQAIETIKKHKEEEARLADRINKGIIDSRTQLSRFDEARLNGRFYSENINDYRQNAEIYGSTARASKSEYQRLLDLAQNETDPEIKEKILKQASDARSTWQFNLGQADSFQQGYITKLQELLSRLVAPDMSPVTSLATIGRDAGSSDNMQRQQRFWDETLTLQREIRDAIDKGVATYD